VNVAFVTCWVWTTLLVASVPLPQPVIASAIAAALAAVKIRLPIVTGCTLAVAADVGGESRFLALERMRFHTGS
jgi:hypothetical protein